MNRLLLIFFLVPLSLFGQSDPLENYLNDYNQELANLLDKIEDNNELVTKATKMTLNLRLKHAENEKSIKAEIQQKNPDYTILQVEAAFTKQLTFKTIINCPSYIRLNRRLLDKCPAENKTLDLIREDIDRLLSANSSKNLLEQKKLADSNFLTIIRKHKSQVSKDYKKGNFDPNLINSLGTYLLHKSDQYCRAYLYEFTENNF